MSDERRLSEVSREILAYLLRNPDARDTLTGVAEWWLLEQQIRRRFNEVEEALVELVQAGYVEVEEAVDGSRHYTFNRRRVAEIRALIDSGTRDG